MGANYRLDYAAFNEHLLNAPFMVEEMRKRAERGKELAEAIAPVGPPPPRDTHAGRYKESFSVEAGEHGGVHNDRAYAVLRNDSPESVIVEFGTENQDGRHVLGRAMDAMR